MDDESLTQELLEDECCTTFCGAFITFVYLFHGCGNARSWKEGTIKSALTKQYWKCLGDGGEAPLATVRERAWVWLLWVPSILGLIIGTLGFIVYLIVILIVVVIGFIVAVVSLVVCCNGTPWGWVWKTVGALALDILNFAAMFVINAIMIVIGVPLGAVLLLIACCMTVPETSELGV